MPPTAPPNTSSTQHQQQQRSASTPALSAIARPVPVTSRSCGQVPQHWTSTSTSTSTSTRSSKPQANTTTSLRFPDGRRSTARTEAGVSGSASAGTSGTMASWRGSGSSTGSCKVNGSGRMTITGRKPRVPGRFVVTDLPPEEEEFESQGPSQSGGGSVTNAEEERMWGHIENEGAVVSAASISSSAPAASAAPSNRRVGQSQSLTQGLGLGPAPLPMGARARAGKTEVRGRFTIIDLSPESPPIAHVASAPVLSEAETLSGPLRIQVENANASPNPMMRRRALPRRFSNSNAHAMAAAAAAALHDAQCETQSASSVSSSAESARRIPMTARYQHAQRGSHAPMPMRTDLSGFDRHLEFLQQESVDMKAILESMITTNARWIDALAASGVGMNRTTSGDSLSSSRTTMQIVEPIEERFARLQEAYVQLEQKYDFLKRQKAQLEHQTAILDSRLQQETKLCVQLRSHVDQLTQYTESLINGTEALCDSRLSAAQLVNLGASARNQQTVIYVDAAVQVDEKMLDTPSSSVQDPDPDNLHDRDSFHARERTSSASSTGSMWNVARRFANALRSYSGSGIYTPSSDILMGTHHVMISELQRAASTSSLTSLDSRRSGSLSRRPSDAMRDSQQLRLSYDRRGSQSSTQSNQSAYSNQGTDHTKQEELKRLSIGSQQSSPVTSEISSLDGPLPSRGRHHRSRASSRNSSEVVSPTRLPPRTIFDHRQPVQ